MNFHQKCHKYVCFENLIPFEMLFTYLAEPGTNLGLRTFHTICLRANKLQIPQGRKYGEWSDRKLIFFFI